MKIEVFNGETFAYALSNDDTDKESIKEKAHYAYFMEYLGRKFNAQSMVIEDHYISKDFLHDYASYYALCFKEYPKHCKRIHFFNTTITEKQFEKALLGKLESPIDIWKKNYLGFIVVKPIPGTVIGYTVLRNYNFIEDTPEREFWGLRPYTIHIFGHKVEFESLAFQEQDSVLSACATTAIWTMLNKASADFHTVLKSPSQITRDAGTMSSDGSRMFPNKGLDVAQICQAIFNSGLVTEVKQADCEEMNEEEYEKEEKKKLDGTAESEDGGKRSSYVSNTKTKKIINAYAGLGIPIILVVEVPDEEGFGLHAIAVSGYKKKPVDFVEPEEQIGWLANNIEKLYAHDDQIGPFVRIEFKNNCELLTPWTENHEKNWSTRVTDIIVPVYPKVRISYEDIEAIVDGLDTLLSGFFKTKIKYDLIWDIQLQMSESFKESAVKWDLDDNSKINLLTQSQPKYIWVVTCYIGKFKTFVFTFDATDVSNGMIARKLISFLPKEFRMKLHDYLNNNREKHSEAFVTKASLGYFDFLVKSLA